jgi:hypothetical protein
LERYADKLLAAKIVEPSQSGWNAAALLIKKANFDPLKRDQLSSRRLCLDYRKQNEVILNDEFQPLTDSQSVFLNIAQTSNRKFYSSIDWTCAFFQCPLDEESRAVTAFSTRTRHLQFTRTSQGLKCSPWAFLSSIYSLFQTELRSNMSVYCDDSLIYHSDYSEHLKFLRGIFEKLRSARLRINPTKSVFAKDKISFLGFEFTSNGVQLDSRRFQKIRDLKPATNVKQVKMLNGFLSYYKKHLPRFAILIAPIRELLKKDVVFHWGDRQNKALEQLKEALIQNVMLHFPDMSKPFTIATDASRIALSHMLMQEKDGLLRPIAFGGKIIQRQ